MNISDCAVWLHNSQHIASDLWLDDNFKISSVEKLFEHEIIFFLQYSHSVQLLGS